MRIHWQAEESGAEQLKPDECSARHARTERRNVSMSKIDRLPTICCLYCCRLL